MCQDTTNRINELLDELVELEEKLSSNPLNASANARWRYVKTLLKELQKED